MGSHTGDFKHILRHAFAFDDDAVVQEPRFHIESHECALGLLAEIRHRIGFPVSHFFIARQNNFQRILVIACFGEEFHRIEENGDAALHVQHARARHFAVFDGEGPRRRCAVSKDRIHVARQDNKGLRHIALLGHQHISCLLIAMETNGEAESGQEFLDVLPYCIDARFVAGAAIPIHQHTPGISHGRLVLFYFLK